jgi:hypothetical protein
MVHKTCPAITSIELNPTLKKHGKCKASPIYFWLLPEPSVEADQLFLPERLLLHPSREVLSL